MHLFVDVRVDMTGDIYIRKNFMNGVSDRRYIHRKRLIYRCKARSENAKDFSFKQDQDIFLL